MASTTITRTNKRILSKVIETATTATTGSWQSTGMSLPLPKGKWYIMAEYRITGSAGNDAGIRVSPPDYNNETFHVRGNNASWNHPVTISAIAEPTSDTTLTISYYVGSTGSTATISHISAIAIEL